MITKPVPALLCTPTSHGPTNRPTPELAQALLVTWAKSFLGLTLKTVSRPKDAVGFVVLPRRWVVERSLAWIMHARRHARDYERLVQHSETLITWAAITLMTRRPTRRRPTRSTVTPSQLTQAA